MSDKTTTAGTSTGTNRTNTRQPRAGSKGPAPGASKESPLSRDAVRHAAYLRWIAAGRPESDGVEFWLAAECELQRSGKTAESTDS